MDQIAWQARRGAGASSFPMVPVAGASLRGTAVLVGADSVRLDVETAVGRIPPFWLVTDRDRRLTTFTGRGSVFQADAERVREPDFVAVTAAFATRPIGALSTRDTVRATLAGAELWLDYGRPSRRGREIFGNVVAWDQVWRTGANAATQLRTSAPISVAGTALPAGTYSVWTLPSRSGWQLILNSQTGQWGTQYDPAHDVVRVKLTSQALAAPVDQLTLTLEREGAASDRGSLVLRWDRTRLSVPIAAGR